MNSTALDVKLTVGELEHLPADLGMATTLSNFHDPMATADDPDNELGPVDSTFILLNERRERSTPVECVACRCTALSGEHNTAASEVEVHKVCGLVWRAVVSSMLMLLYSQSF